MWDLRVIGSITPASALASATTAASAPVPAVVKLTEQFGGVNCFIFPPFLDPIACR